MSPNGLAETPGRLSGPTRLLFQAGLPLAVLLGAAALTEFTGAAPLGLALVLAMLAWLAVRWLLAHVERVCADQTVLKEQLIQSQKLAVLGELSSGVAHEINTPLAVILQETELIRAACEDMPSETPGLAALDQGLRVIESQVEHCASVTHGMLQMVRKSQPVSQPTDLPALCEDMVALIEREARQRDVLVERTYAPDLPLVRTDPPLLKQVLLNLLVNAVQAVSRGGAIRVGVVRCPGGAVRITVQDNGPGIPPECLDKIFNPFFTTKPPGQGTGLGLSISLGIVDRLGGTLTAVNAQQGGALFTVRLPVEGARPADSPQGGRNAGCHSSADRG